MQIEYLGHVVSEAVVQMDLDKVAAILKCPIPSNIKQLRGYLGLNGYYHRFIHHYAHIAHSLTELLKKVSFQWSTQAQLAFDNMKSVITSAQSYTYLISPNHLS